jgi:hypothetical protein
MQGEESSAGNVEIWKTEGSPAGRVSVFYNCDVEEGSKAGKKEEENFIPQASGVTTPRQPTSELFTRAELNIHSR